MYAMSFVDHIMSDIFTSNLSDGFDERKDGDNLVEFLTKLARFGIDQCLQFVHLIANQQRLIEHMNSKHSIYQDKRVINSVEIEWRSDMSIE